MWDFGDGKQETKQGALERTIRESNCEVEMGNGSRNKARDSLHCMQALCFSAYEDNRLKDNKLPSAVITGNLVAGLLLSRTEQLASNATLRRKEDLERANWVQKNLPKTDWSFINCHSHPLSCSERSVSLAKWQLCKPAQEARTFHISLFGQADD